MCATTDRARVRELNDHLRQNISRGSAVMTPGVAALGSSLVEKAITSLAAFDDFHHANDPHEEHDFGIFDIDGHVLMFKIDYYDKGLQMHSTDPADPEVTERIITLMLAAEY